MSKTNSPLLKDPNMLLSNDVFSHALGDAYESYLKFIQALIPYDIQLSWRYYHDGNVWLAKGIYAFDGPRGGSKEVTIFWLSIWEGFFKVTFYVLEKRREDVLKLPLDHAVKQKIEAAKTLGKLRFFPIDFDLYSDKGFDTVLLLLDYKKKNT